MNKEPRAPHILNASSNLVGFCFLVITSLRFFDQDSKTIVDEVATYALLLFTASCIFSFLSLRSKTRNSEIYETIADYIFLSGLILMLVSTLLVALKLIH